MKVTMRNDEAFDSGATVRRLVLPAEMRFDDLARALEGRGWQRSGTRLASEPILPGEPELASWWAAERTALLTYTFNPVTRLRLIALSGVEALSHADELERELPIVGSVEDLSRSAVPQPERSTLFANLRGASARRQILRWLLHDNTSANVHIERTLREALADPDWEVRATAMLLVARFGLTSLWPDIRRMALPRVTREGPAKPDREILLALRNAALAHLRPELSPDVPEVQSSRKRDEVWQHLLACVAGTETSVIDRVFLLVHALTEPLNLDGPPPSPLPPPVVADGEGYCLRNSRTTLRWVAPIAHWLGSADADLSAAHPVERVRPSKGFFVSADPCARGERLDLVSYAAALDLCEQMSVLEGSTIELVTAQQWEMAMRGPDARRHPWGNGLEAAAPGAAVSPWGVSRPFGAGEWTRTADSMGRRVVMGCDRYFRCAARRWIAPDEEGRFAVRLVVSA